MMLGNHFIAVKVVHGQNSRAKLPVHFGRKTESVAPIDSVNFQRSASNSIKISRHANQELIRLSGFLEKINQKEQVLRSTLAVLFLDLASVIEEQLTAEKLPTSTPLLISKKTLATIFHGIHDNLTNVAYLIPDFPVNPADKVAFSQTRFSQLLKLLGAELEQFQQININNPDRHQNVTARLPLQLPELADDFETLWEALQDANPSAPIHRNRQNTEIPADQLTRVLEGLGHFISIASDFEINKLKQPEKPAS